MNKFIHRENMALFWRRLAHRDLTAAQRKVILKLLTEKQAKNFQTTPSTEDVERPSSYSLSRGRPARAQSRTFILMNAGAHL